jgi:hypothetical protein
VPNGLPSHNLLPDSVQRALVEAARVDPDAPPGESLPRSCAVDAVIRRTRAQYLELFKSGDAWT